VAHNPRPAGSLRSRLFGWWYVSIGAGFLLLAVNRLIVGGAPWLIALRFAISAGFFWLGWFELRSKRVR
jgi:hypothetical protein